VANRDYPDNGYPSVTQVLGVLRKVGLEMWYKYNTATFCDEKSNKGKLAGKQIHAAIEEYINTGVAKVETNYVEEVTNALKGFMLFRKEHPEYILKNSELQLTSEQHRVNGTLDCEASVNDEPVIFDWKTGECKKADRPAVYPEHLLQVSAYVTFFNEIKKTNIEKARILVLAKDKIAYSLYPMEKLDIDYAFNQGFLPALKNFHCQKTLDAQLKTFNKGE
jgi:hypothetical protein